MGFLNKKPIIKTEGFHHLLKKPVFQKIQSKLSLIKKRFSKIKVRLHIYTVNYMMYHILKL